MADELTPTPRVLRWRDTLTQDERELFDFIYQFDGNMALAFIGFTMACGMEGERDLFVVLGKFRERLRAELKTHD